MARSLLLLRVALLHQHFSGREVYTLGRKAASVVNADEPWQETAGSSFLFPLFLSRYALRP